MKWIIIIIIISSVSSSFLLNWSSIGWTGLHSNVSHINSTAIGPGVWTKNSNTE